MLRSTDTTGGDQTVTVSEMTHWERVRAALKGEETDRVPIALWRHWPPDDETPEGLAAVSLRWQQAYDFDLVKLTPTGTYGIEDWGGRTTYTSADHGMRSVVKHGVTSADKWPCLERLDVTQNYLGNQIAAVRMVADELQSSAPILQTVFSPLTTARKLAGDRVFTHLRLHPEALKAGLQIIAETHARFALESLRAGAHGIFFATQCDSYQVLSEAEYREFGEVYDRMILDAVRPESEIILIHAHGYDIMFDLLAGYPADAINWHDRSTPPTLKEAQERFHGMVVGGIDEWHTLLDGPIEAIRAEIRDAISQTGGRRFMVGPGCVVPINTSPLHLRAARQAVEG
jgi:uroporphyrinogen decarboxylase